MIYNNVILEVNDPANIETVRGHLIELAKASLEEPGCIKFDVHQSKMNLGLFFLIEEWESQDALDFHRGEPAFAEHYLPNVVPLVNRQPHPCGRVWPE